MKGLAKKKGYEQHMKNLGDELYAVEHTYTDNCNVAVAVMANGQYYVGVARAHPDDNYNRKLGHEIAVGRALYSAWTRPGDHDGTLWDILGTQLTGRELGDACRKVAKEYER